MAGATKPILYTLVGSGASTAWLDLRGVYSGVQVNILISGTLTVVVDTANDVIAQTDSVQTTESFTSSQSRVFSAPLPRLMRFRNSSGSGTATISFGRIFDAHGNPSEIGENPTSNTPVGTF